MILHSIQIGNRHIHVRTDDCDQRELERIHETVRLVGRMLNRHGSEAYGLIAGLVAFLAVAIITMSIKPGAAVGWIVIPLVAFGLTSLLGWRLIGDAVQRRQLADVAHLQALTTASIRCRDFVIECAEASPALSRVLGKLAPRPQAA